MNVLAVQVCSSRQVFGQCLRRRSCALFSFDRLQAKVTSIKLTLTKCEGLFHGLFKRFCKLFAAWS